MEFSSEGARDRVKCVIKKAQLFHFQLFLWRENKQKNNNNKRTVKVPYTLLLNLENYLKIIRNYLKFLNMSKHRIFYLFIHSFIH